MFTLRFDLRAPEWGAPIENLYSAALDMAAWSERRGAVVAVLSEHHATDDRHLPSPLVVKFVPAAKHRLALGVSGGPSATDNPPLPPPRL